jgi:hypothetical protein
VQRVGKCSGVRHSVDRCVCVCVNKSKTARTYGLLIAHSVLRTQDYLTDRVAQTDTQHLLSFCQMEKTCSNAPVRVIFTVAFYCCPT